MSGDEFSSSQALVSAATALIEKASSREVTLATAESCTGGLVAATITSVPGASAAFTGAVVAYSDRLKTVLLGVGAETLTKSGAVSVETATAMAKGARDRLGADFAVALTGVAGPGGGSDRTPVGTVCLAVAGPAQTQVTTEHFSGDRDEVRAQATSTALAMLSRALDS